MALTGHWRGWTSHKPPAHRKSTTINCGDCGHLSRRFFKSSTEPNPRALSLEVFLFWILEFPLNHIPLGQVWTRSVCLWGIPGLTGARGLILGFLRMFLQTARSSTSELLPTPCSHGVLGQMFIQLRKRKTWGRSKINIWDSKQKQNQKIVQTLTLIFPSSTVWKKKKRFWFTKRLSEEKHGVKLWQQGCYSVQLTGAWALSEPRVWKKQA